MFALLALSIAVTGLYGVLSYNVSQRRKEIGIRSALGATRADLIGLVLRQGLTVTMLGLAAGVLIAGVAWRGCSRCCSALRRSICHRSSRCRPSC